jgi:hypothetical protein
MFGISLGVIALWIIRNIRIIVQRQFPTDFLVITLIFRDSVKVMFPIKSFEKLNFSNFPSQDYLCKQYLK